MSKKTFMATIIISALLISVVAGIQGVRVAKSNPSIPSKHDPLIEVKVENQE